MRLLSRLEAEEQARAFSSEVDAGSREENTLKQKSSARSVNGYSPNAR
jgi:hypothetical protein